MGNHHTKTGSQHIKKGKRENGKMGKIPVLP